MMNVGIKYSRPIVFLIWILVFGYALTKHTPWRDEYQSWLVATRTQSLPEFFEGVRYERHPPLHYIFERAAFNSEPESWRTDAKLSINLVTTPFVVGTAILLLWFLPMTLLQSSLAIFGSLLLREYGVISRAYIIGIFFLLLFVVLRNRNQRATPELALAASMSTHLLFTLVGGAFFVIETLRQRPLVKFRLKTFAFALFSVLILFLQRPPVDSEFPTRPEFGYRSVIAAFQLMNQALWQLERVWKPYAWNQFPIATQIGIGILVASLFWIRRSVAVWKVLFVMFPACLLLASSYFPATRHLGVATFGFLALILKLDERQSKRENAATNVSPTTVLCFCMFISAVNWWVAWAPFRNPPNFDFSTARELKEKMGSQLVVANSTFVVDELPLFFTWMAEANTTVFDSRRDKISHYPHFTLSDLKFHSIGEWCSKRLSDFEKTSKTNRLFFGMRKGTPLPESCGQTKQVFSSERPCGTDEVYDVYERSISSVESR